MEHKPLILAIDTSEVQCSVALLDRNQVIGSLTEKEQKSHAAKLLPMIDYLLYQSKISLKDLSALAISAGPGSYTGLRIGVSTVKGLSMATDKPVMAIDTLYAMATNSRLSLEQKFDFYIPTIDARRDEVYTLVMEHSGQLCEATHSRILDVDSYRHYLERGKCLVMGSGADKISGMIGYQTTLFLQPDTVPHASQLLSPAFAAYDQNDFVDISMWEPNYLKEFYSASFKKGG